MAKEWGLGQGAPPAEIRELENKVGKGKEENTSRAEGMACAKAERSWSAPG